MPTSDRSDYGAPFFSICIPQYNRTSHLLRACESLARQRFRDFEVCISDDRSTDGRADEVLKFLEESGLSFQYTRQQTNLRYDGNLRAAIDLAKGQYCFLHGNDDCLADDLVLMKLRAELAHFQFPEVVITNFEDWRTGRTTHRVPETRLLGSGPQVAVTNFRNVSFVSGVIVDRRKAQSLGTNTWDGSEMYQMYLTSGIIAGGGRLLNLAITVVKKDIIIPGDDVDSYARRRRTPRWPIREIELPMSRIGSLVEGSIRSFVPARDYGRTVESIFIQLYRFTYPFWYVEYRRVQSWSYSCGVFIGVRPGKVLGDIRLGPLRRIRLYIYYWLGGAAGLLAPLRIIQSLLPAFYRFAKRQTLPTN